jgi:hypothetical protein
MNDICVPNSALESEEEFHNWYLRMRARLFPAVQKIYVHEIQEQNVMMDLTETFNKILSWVNFVLNKTWEPIPIKYRKQAGIRKSKGSNKTVTDVLSMAVNAMLSYYDVTQARLANILNMNRTAISYYISRHKANCLYKEYLKKYNELLIHLRNEGIISTIG